MASSAEVVPASVLDAESVGLVSGHEEHGDAEYQKEDAGSDLAARTLVKDEESLRVATESDVGVSCASHLDGERVVEETDFLLELSRVCQLHAVLNTASTSDLPRVFTFRKLQIPSGASAIFLIDARLVISIFLLVLVFGLRLFWLLNHWRCGPFELFQTLLGDWQIVDEEANLAEFVIVYAVVGV